MLTRTPLWRALGLVLLALALSAWSCETSGIENNCRIGQDLTWQANGMSLERSEPRQCPYVVLAPWGRVPLKEIVIAPDAYTYTGLLVTGTVYDAANANVSNGIVGSYYQPQYDGTAYATVEGEFFGATSDPIYDSAWVAS
jgi:hypothetical protein